jgi:hypothetical protein
MKADQILSACSAAQRVGLIFEEHLPAVKSEADFYAKVRFVQFTAYRNAGFTVDQCMQLMALPRLQT